MSMHWQPLNCAFFGLMFLLMTGSGWQPAVANTVLPLPAQDQAQLIKLLGSGIVGEALPSAPLAASETYLPRKGAAMTYQVLKQGGGSATEIHKLEDSSDATFTPGWHYSAGSKGGAFFQTQNGQDGNLLTMAEQDFDHQVLSRFTPGEPLIIAGLNPGESRQFTITVDVADLSDLTKISHTGSLSVSYTYIGTYRVTVPAGAYDAVLIKWDYNGSVGPATIKDSQYRFLAPGAGMVAMIQIRSISAMLFYNDHTKLGKLLQHTE